MKTKSSEQKSPEVNPKSGKVVAKLKYGKTDVRYWQEQIYKPEFKQDGKTLESPDYAVRIQHRGKREFFLLRTSNAAAAAAKAKDIYSTLIGAGRDAALEKFKPEMQRRSISTVGDFLSELKQHWDGKTRTFEVYCRCFRSIVSQIFEIDGGKARYDYVTGGRDKWIAKINQVKLEKVTPAEVNKWRISFVKRAGANPVKQRRARITCNSLIRQAKSLFRADLLAHVALHKPDVQPFEGVAFYPRESQRYHSRIDVESMIQEAQTELPTEQFKIFILAAMAGLRRNEIDKLQWSAFHWSKGIIRIEATEAGDLKSADSAGDVPIDPEPLALFRGWKARSTSPFVIEGGNGESISTEAGYFHYRAESHFNKLTAWLRAKGITANKPLHELRKEFGSQICAKNGIYAASRMLRHADIALTAQHYLDTIARVTFGMGGLLETPDNVVSIEQPPTPEKQTAPKVSKAHS